MGIGCSLALEWCDSLSLVSLSSSSREAQRSVRAFASREAAELGASDAGLSLHIEGDVCLPCTRAAWGAPLEETDLEVVACDVEGRPSRRAVKWCALVPRGQTSFESKAIVARANGASLVVVADYERMLVRMAGNAVDVPVVMVTSADAALLEKAGRVLVKRRCLEEQGVDENALRRLACLRQKKTMLACTSVARELCWTDEAQRWLPPGLWRGAGGSLFCVRHLDLPDGCVDQVRRLGRLEFLDVVGGTKIEHRGREVDLAGRDLRPVEIALMTIVGCRKLDVAANSLGTPRGIRAMAPACARLETLSLWGNDVTDAAVRVLVACALQLRSLDLHDNRIGDDGAKDLATLEQLTRLDVSHNEIGDPGALALASSKTPSLYLDASKNKFSAVGVRSLAGVGARVASDSKNLDLSHQGVAPLLACGLSDLQSVDVSHCRLDDADLRAVVESLAASPNLESLDVSENNYTMGGLGDVAPRFSRFEQLRVLRVTVDDHHNDAKDTAVKLAEALRHVREIALSSTRDRGANRRRVVCEDLTNRRLGDVAAVVVSRRHYSNLDFSGNDLRHAWALDALLERFDSVDLMGSLTPELADRAARIVQKFPHKSVVGAPRTLRRFNAVTDADAVLVASELGRPQTAVTDVTLPGITVQGVLTLARGIRSQTTPSLLSLDFRGSKPVFGDVRATAALVDALAIHPSITKLHLRQCGLTDATASEFATLQHLTVDISANPELTLFGRRKLDHLT